MGRKPRGMRLVFVGRSSVAVALSFCLLGAWTALVAFALEHGLGGSADG